MILVTHPVRGAVKPLEIHMTTDPLSIWLSATCELQIEIGDRLADVAIEVENIWPVDTKTARQLVAYWFALGEAITRDKVREFTPHDLRVKGGRRYRNKLRTSEMEGS